MPKEYQRDIVKRIVKRLQEPRRFIQVLIGPRQTGKTKAITQAIDMIDIPRIVGSADRIASMKSEWLEQQWRQARALIRAAAPSALLIIDEVQNIEQWSSTVKALWDEDARSGIDLRVLLSGSSSLLLQKGLAESLMGRYEVLRNPHWRLAEMREAFGYSLDEFLLFGGYPAGSFLKDDSERWLWYMTDAVSEATISRDVLQMEEVRRPALLRSLYLLGCQFSSQQLSYRNIQGQLDDRGNVATIAHYLELLAHAGLLCGLPKYDSKELETRRSSPRLQVFDSSLMTSASRSKAELLLGDPELRGHLVETAVGSYLLGRSTTELFDLYWWREGRHEVDFVLERGRELIAIEVKSGRMRGATGLREFCRRWPKARPLVIGDENNSLEDFLLGRLPLFD